MSVFVFCLPPYRGIQSEGRYEGLRKRGPTGRLMGSVEFGDIALNFAMEIEEALQHGRIAGRLEHVTKARFHFEQIVHRDLFGWAVGVDLGGVKHGCHCRTRAVSCFSRAFALPP